MNDRQGVKYIGSYIWRRERLGIFFTFLFAIYMGAVMGPNLNSIWAGEVKAEGVAKFLYGMTDWLYLTMFPVYGMVMNKSAWGMWKDDQYSKRLAHWRAMPIPLAVIVKGRFLQMAFTLPVVGAVFLVLQYSVSPDLRGAITPSQWLENGLLWMCYGFAANALYIWFELGFSGRKYVQFYMGYMLLMAIIVTTWTWQGFHLFKHMIQVIDNGNGWMLILIMAIAAIAATWIGYRATVNRIRGRSLTF
ncbi:hypothetical protein [Cohnella mopanensis]|uniref:hypothetical protein n=1 Tax=Cohnella mopanensis TaxID=2911966 RepID=UPI001EF85532|nr:hypothetical protein [Cohnella mopanensis]